jgi:carboxylate-amine ligase
LRLTTFTERLAALLDHVRPALERFGDSDQDSDLDSDLRSLVRSVLARGNGAVRQRRAFSLRGAAADVVDNAAHVTVEGLSPDSPADAQPIGTWGTNGVNGRSSEMPS